MTIASPILNTALARVGPWDLRWPVLTAGRKVYTLRQKRDAARAARLACDWVCVRA
ncbi:hypothetical protein LXM60_15445 [Pandoraea sputorum]|uniref:hypothetical protein n=1 Tax=Pandoraea sputorum TaxID=93222 RepID=UPI001E45BA2A|nr:hypothetical protein [Pandoraea sputorum]MCE4061597.1 hypothetical protein [Pandoraea sputorum]